MKNKNHFIKMNFLLSIIFVILSYANLFSYDPPMGIPDPTTYWGGMQDPINDEPPSRPTSWTSEIAGYYYVNYQTGSDAGRTYGYPSKPRATIPNPIPAGSYVEVHGNYNYITGGDVRINGNGTSDAWSPNSAGPVWIVGVEGNVPTFTGKKTLITGDYVYLYNINISGITSGNCLQVGSSSTGYDADYIVIRNCDIQGTSSSGYGVSITANSTDQGTRCLVYNNTIHDHGPSYDIDQDSHMINISSYWTYVWILNNNCYNSSGSGMQVGPSSPGPQYIFIGDNIVNNSRQSGIWVKYGTDVIISKNIVHDVQDRCAGSDTSPSKGLGAQYGPVRVWWLFNTVYNCRYLIRVPSTNNSNTTGEYYAIGNLLYNQKDMGGTCFSDPNGKNVWDPAAIHIHGGSTRVIVGNTIFNVQSGIHVSRSSSNDLIENNIISTVTHKNGRYVYDYSASIPINNCVFFNLSGGGDAFKWGSGTTYATLSAFQSATSEADNSFEDDPRFVSDGEDFSLKPGSPAINTGLDASSLTIDVYSRFQSLYGINIRKDIVGTVRPQDGAWDIGAYEAIGGGGTSPSIPKGVKIEKLK